MEYCRAFPGGNNCEESPERPGYCAHCHYAMPRKPPIEAPGRQVLPALAPIALLDRDLVKLAEQLERLPDEKRVQMFRFLRMLKLPQELKATPDSLRALRNAYLFEFGPDYDDRSFIDWCVVGSGLADTEGSVEAFYERRAAERREAWG